MKLLACALLSLLVSAASPSETTTPSPPVRVKGTASNTVPQLAIAGDYRADQATVVHVTHMEGSIYRMQCDSWEGAGLLEGTTWFGVFRLARAASDTSRPVVGQLTVEFADRERPRVAGKYTTTKPVEFQEIWSRVTPGEANPPRMTDGPPPIAVSDSVNPRFGQYVYVDELPEAITKVSPARPECGRAGTVVIQALVGRDGTITDTKIVKSDDPCLNDSAVAAVQRWRFKPATAKGKPVAVWVAVPIKFSVK